MFAFIFVPNEGHVLVQNLMLTATVVVFAACVAFYAGKGLAALYRALTAWRGDAQQMDLFEITIQHKRDRWRKVIAAALVAVALASGGWIGVATLHADVVITCDQIPWWTIEYWWLCSK